MSWRDRCHTACENVHERPNVQFMAGQRSRRRIPEATVARLPVYLRILTEQFEVGVLSMSSDELAEFAGVNAAKVRKDLSYLGTYGTRGVGYDVEFLVYQPSRTSTTGSRVSPTRSRRRRRATCPARVSST